MKLFSIIVLVAFAAMLVHGGVHLPARGGVDAPSVRGESVTGTVVAADYFVRYAYRDSNTPNIVTAVLGDYRSVDTLGEQVCIFTAGIICLLLLRKTRSDEDRLR